MGKLTPGQRETLREFLLQQGLTFKPLRDEMFDHVLCDLELNMADGRTFDEAWQLSFADLPSEHFHKLQQETMTTINKRFTIAQGFSWLALAALFSSVLFKVMHFPLSSELLLVSFASMAVGLLTSALSGVFLQRGRRGAFGLLSVVSGVILLMTGFAFNILHLPGGAQIIILAVSITSIGMIVNTTDIYRNASGTGTLLTWMHEKYSPGIERFLLLILVPTMLYKISAMITQPSEFIGDVVLIIVIFGAGLQFIAMNWRVMSADLTKARPVNLLLLVAAFLILTLLFLGPVIPYSIRVVKVITFCVAACALSLRMENTTLPSRLFQLFFPAVFSGWALVRLGVLPELALGWFFNLPVLIVLVAGLFIAPRNSMARTYMMISLASYLFEYPYRLGIL